MIHKLKGNLEKNLLIKNEFEAYKDAFNRVNKMLEESKVDTRCRYFFSNILLFSGTTCVSALIRKQRIIIANIGDSRCILCTKNGIKQLTTDHKPNIKGEITRILSMGGSVAQMEAKNGKKIGPFRVWFKNGFSPGLAMSRSIGDSLAKKIGVISEPGIF